MLADTHCHLDLLAGNTFDNPLTQAEISGARGCIDRARAAGVEILVAVGVNVPTSRNCIALARTYTHVFATVGIHPEGVTQSFSAEFAEIKKTAMQYKNAFVVGIGECGLDRKYAASLEMQKDAFRKHIELALELGLPLVVHVREAHDETLAILDEFGDALLAGVMHCFSGTPAYAADVIERGFYLGIGGIITYPKNQPLRDLISAIGLERVVLETDAPFLPPQHMRGEKNEPAQVRTIADYCAQLLAIDVKEVEKITTRNACALFDLSERISES